MKDGSLLKTLSAHRGGVYGVAMSPAGDRMYSCGSDNTIQVHRPAGLRVLHQNHHAVQSASRMTHLQLSAVHLVEPQAASNIAMLSRS